MGVAGQDHVDAPHPRGHLVIDVKAVMRQADDQIDALRADLVHHLLHPLFADPEAVVGKHPFGVGDRQVRECLPDHGDGQPAPLEDAVSLEGGLVPFRIEDVRAQEGKGQPGHDLAHPVLPERPFPVAGHRVGAQRVHHIDHVLPLAEQAGHRAVPRVAAIQQQRIRPGRADRRDHARDPVHAAHPAVAAGERLEILAAQRIGVGRARRDAEGFEESLSGEMGRPAARLADADVHFGFAKPQRHQLGVDVGDMDQGGVAVILEGQKLVLAQRLAGRDARPAAEARDADQRRGGKGCLKELASRDHVRISVSAGHHPPAGAVDGWSVSCCIWQPGRRPPGTGAPFYWRTATPSIGKVIPREAT